ncbi:hypothetical protein AB3S75_005333 [Citrus x aurantiifolia]
MSLVLLLPLPRVRNDHLRMTSADFDSKPLELGAKLLREISAYRNAKLSHHNVELLEFPLPGKEECFKLLKLYLDKYTADDTLMEAAGKIEGICRSIQASAEKETCSTRRRKREIQE